MEIPQIQNSFAVLSGIRELLQENFSQDSWKTHSNLQVFKSRSPNQHVIRIERNFDSVNKALSDACELALK